MASIQTGQANYYVYQGVRHYLKDWPNTYKFDYTLSYSSDENCYILDWKLISISVAQKDATRWTYVYGYKVTITNPDGTSSTLTSHSYGSGSKFKAYHNQVLASGKKKFNQWTTDATRTITVEGCYGTTEASGVCKAASGTFKVPRQPALTVTYYGNGATSGTLQGAAISNPGGSLSLTNKFYRDSTYANGLSDMDNPSYLNLQRSGYTPAKAWGTSTTGGSLINQNYQGTGKQIANQLGKDLITTDISVNVYAQWTQSGLAIHYDFWTSPEHPGTPLGLGIISSTYKFMPYQNYKRIGTLAETSNDGSTIESLPKDNSKKHTVLHPSQFGVYCAGYTFLGYTTNLNSSVNVGQQCTASDLNTADSTDTWIHAGSAAWRENILTQDSPSWMEVTVPGESAFAKFIPTVTKTYIFFSSDTDSDFTMGGKLLNSQFEMITPIKEELIDGEIALSYNLTKGQTYYFTIYDKNIGATTGKTKITIASTTYTLTVNKQPGIRTVSGGGEKMPMSKCTIRAQAEAGYTFDGWYSVDNVNLIPDNPYVFNMPAKNCIITAYAAVNTYKITYNSTGVSSVTDGRTFYYNQSYTLLNCPFSKTGYTFAGWDTDEEATTVVYGNQATISELVPSGTANLYAVWSPNPYTVTFNPNTGSVSTTSKTVYYGSAYGELPTPTKSGSTFAGWFTAASGGTKIQSTTQVTTNGNHTLYAHWTTSGGTITYNLNGGSRKNFPTSQSYTTKEDVYCAISTKDDIYYKKNGTLMNFVGWNTSSSSTTASYTYMPERTINLTSNITLYAVWRDPTSLTGLSGSVSSNLYYKNQTVYHKITATRKTEYKFTMSSTDWLNVKIFLVDKDNNQISYTSLRSQDSEMVYTFIIPQPESSSETYYLKLHCVTSPFKAGSSTSAVHTVSTKYVINPFYDVNFNYQGGTPASPTSKEVKYRDPYGELPIPTQKGYEFLGWYTHSNEGTKINEDTVVNLTADQTLYAHWDLIGLVQVYYDGQWKKAIPYVYYNGQWRQAMGHTYYRDDWRLGTNYGQHKLIE